jgi:enamine deaminase RidA (YjgF/YER057c/UK114 family)
MSTTCVPSGSRDAPVIGFSAAVRAGEVIHVAGTTAVDGFGEITGECDAYAQAREALRKIELSLRELGCGARDVLQTRMYLTRATDWEAVGRAHGDVFNDHRPAATMVVVAALLDPRMLVEIEAVARRPAGAAAERPAVKAVAANRAAHRESTRC